MGLLSGVPLCVHLPAANDSGRRPCGSCAFSTKRLAYLSRGDAQDASFRFASLPFSCLCNSVFLSTDLPAANFILSDLCFQHCCALPPIWSLRVNVCPGFRLVFVLDSVFRIWSFQADFCHGVCFSDLTFQADSFPWILFLGSDFSGWFFPLDSVSLIWSFRVDLLFKWRFFSLWLKPFKMIFLILRLQTVSVSRSIQTDMRLYYRVARPKLSMFHASCFSDCSSFLTWSVVTATFLIALSDLKLSDLYCFKMFFGWSEAFRLMFLSFQTSDCCFVIAASFIRPFQGHDASLIALSMVGSFRAVSLPQSFKTDVFFHSCFWPEAQYWHLEGIQAAWAVGVSVSSTESASFFSFFLLLV